jgi:hypothetical protein
MQRSCTGMMIGIISVQRAGARRSVATHASAHRVLLFLLAAVVMAPRVPGQTLFMWPKDSAHVTAHATVDACLEAAKRTDRRFQKPLLWRDTLPNTRARHAAEARATLPTVVRSVAQQCTERFLAATTPLSDFAPLLHLELAAGLDSTARVLIERRFAAIGAKGGDERVAVLDTVLDAYLGQYGTNSFFLVRPARRTAAESLLTHEMRAVPWQTRLRDGMGLMYAAWDAADSVQAQRLANWEIALAASLTEDQRRTNDFTMYSEQLNQALAISQRGALLDSLRRSTSAYAALYRAQLEVLTGHHGMPAGLVKPIGESAPAISADYWLPRNDSLAARPVKGKVNVVAFLRPYFGFDNALSYHKMYATLHRLAERFPKVEFTLVARTKGFFSYAAPPPPSAEAAMMGDAWLRNRDLPGVLAVTNTPFWRLPAPDRRRIDRQTPNDTRYSFGRSWLQPIKVDDGEIEVALFLIDEKGVVVDAPYGLSAVDADWPEMIEILFERGAATGGQNAVPHKPSTPSSNRGDSHHVESASLR